MRQSVQVVPTHGGILRLGRETRTGLEEPVLGWICDLELVVCGGAGCDAAVNRRRWVVCPVSGLA